jgi:hypothetical protein
VHPELGLVGRQDAPVAVEDSAAYGFELGGLASEALELGDSLLNRGGAQQLHLRQAGYADRQKHGTENNKNFDSFTIHKYKSFAKLKLGILWERKNLLFSFDFFFLKHDA